MKARHDKDGGDFDKIKFHCSMAVDTIEAIAHCVDTSLPIWAVLLQ